jgi:hypothetical protein
MAVQGGRVRPAIRHARSSLRSGSEDHPDGGGRASDSTAVVRPADRRNARLVGLSERDARLAVNSAMTGHECFHLCPAGRSGGAICDLAVPTRIWDALGSAHCWSFACLARSGSSATAAGRFRSEPGDTPCSRCSSRGPTNSSLLIAWSTSCGAKRQPRPRTRCCTIRSRAASCVRPGRAAGDAQ